MSTDELPEQERRSFLGKRFDGSWWRRGDYAKVNLNENIQKNVPEDERGYGFYFLAQSVTLPGPVVTALKVDAGARTEAQKDALAKHYISIAPELALVL